MVNPVISHNKSIVLSIFSITGVVLLLFLGLCYHSGDPQFTHGMNRDSITKASNAAFIAAAIYFVLLLFSLFQWRANLIQQRNSLLQYGQSGYRSRAYDDPYMDLNYMKQLKADQYHSLQSSHASTSSSVAKTL